MRIDDGVEYPQPPPEGAQPLRVHQLYRGSFTQPPSAHRRLDVEPLQPPTASNPTHATGTVRGIAVPARRSERPLLAARRAAPSVRHASASHRTIRGVVRRARAGGAGAAEAVARRPLPASLRVAVRAVRLLHLGGTIGRVAPVRVQAAAGVPRGAGDPRVPRRTGNGHLHESSPHLSSGRGLHAGNALIRVRCHEVLGPGQILGVAQLSAGAAVKGAAQPRPAALRQVDPSRTSGRCGAP